MRNLGLVAALIAMALPVTASCQSEPPVDAIIGDREETVAREVATLAYVYGYPAVDYLRLLHENTTPGSNGYSAVGKIYNGQRLTKAGERVYADGRAKTPNNDTIYFRSWIDLRSGPAVVSMPDTADRYYTLTFADLYSEVQHTGRRTTGTGAQKILVIGPGWRGAVPAGMVPVRIRTNQVLMLGRMLARPGNDEKRVASIIDHVAIDPLTPGLPPAAPMRLPTRDDMTELSFFTSLNRFLRENPRLPGEEALMAQFDQVGIGPSTTFDPTRLSEATLRGLRSGIADGRRLVTQGRFNRIKGWTSATMRLGEYGYDYLTRAAVEFSGLHANLNAEAVYLRTAVDVTGAALVGTKRYRLVLPADRLPPAEAFWSLTPYDMQTFDMIRNGAGRYSVGDRTTDLKRRPDGSIVVAIQKDRPVDEEVNWLPVSEKPFFLIMRIYQPRPEVLDGSYRLPELEAVN